MDNHKNENDLRIGDQVRRRGILAEMFGDEDGIVVNVRHEPKADKYEVKFGSRLVVYTSHQIIPS